jgi:hypothetical protein
MCQSQAPNAVTVSGGGGCTRVRGCVCGLSAHQHSLGPMAPKQ